MCFLDVVDIPSLLRLGGSRWLISGGISRPVLISRVSILLSIQQCLSFGGLLLTLLMEIQPTFYIPLIVMR